MNITTHGKDGPKVSFLAAERRCYQRAMADMEYLSTMKGDLGEAASEAHAALRAVIEIVDDPTGKVLDGIPDQHREENTEEHEQKLSGAGKR